jgi:hypothetical protein
MLIARPPPAVKTEKQPVSVRITKMAQEGGVGSRMSCPCIGSGTSDSIARNEDLVFVGTPRLAGRKIEVQVIECHNNASP